MVHCKTSGMYQKNDLRFDGSLIPTISIMKSDSSIEKKVWLNASHKQKSPLNWDRTENQL